VTLREPPPASPLKPWQSAELCALLLVTAVQLWLSTVSVVAAAAWGVLVPVLLIHVYFWMAPLLRQQGSRGGREERDHPRT
jgi:hypothetical protein